MKIQQTVLRNANAATPELDSLSGIAPQLVLAFGAPQFFSADGVAAKLPSKFPQATVVGCSTAGEIATAGVQENALVVTAVNFDKTQISSATTDMANMDDSRAAGVRLAQKIASPELRLVMVFGQGVNINGSALLEGMTEILGLDVPITGGLAGDNGAFKQTWTLNQAGVSDRALVAIGFSGDALNIAHGSFGGWETFGPARKATRCEGNVLFELDGEPALEVYKRYLGDYARDLPASGLLFPFAMLGEEQSALGLIRTILGIDEANGSLILAGEIHQNGYLKLMHASTDKLVDGAEAAAKRAVEMSHQQATSLAILVSCVGRKLVMGDRVEEEVEAVTDVLGNGATCTGFYSYGEISPFTPGVSCKLHNQTMTITTIAEG